MPSKAKKRTAAGHKRAIKNTKFKRKILSALFGPICLCCKKPLTETQMTLDHVVSAAKGGKGHITNLQIMCVPCNERKANGVGDYRPWTIVQYLTENVDKLYEQFAKED